VLKKQPCSATDTLHAGVMNKCRERIIGSEFGVTDFEVPLTQNLKKMPFKISLLGSDIV
jgi:hypothetical protein